MTRKVIFYGEKIELGNFTVDVSQVYRKLRDNPQGMHVASAALPDLLEVCNVNCWLPTGQRHYKFLLVLEKPRSRQQSRDDKLFEPTGNMRLASIFALIAFNAGGVFNDGRVVSRVTDQNTKFFADHHVVIMQSGTIVNSLSNRMMPTENRAFLYWEEV